MIVLEGPDGAGKTRLANEVAGMLRIKIGPRAADSLGGPVTSLKQWVDADLKSWPYRQCEVRDRYPLISETIYRPTLDQTLGHGFNAAWLRRTTAQFRRQALVIFCLPPLETVLENVRVEQQMEGVMENIRQLYWHYHVTAMQWPGFSYTHNYTDPNSIDQVFVMAKQHKDRWY